MVKDKKKVKEEPKEVESTIPKKPDEKSHPDPLKRFEALKKWRIMRDKILGHEEVMKYEPEKTVDKAADKARENIQKGTEAIKVEIGEVEIKEKKKKLSSAEQLAELKRIRKNNKRKKDKEAEEAAKKKKKKIDN